MKRILLNLVLLAISFSGINAQERITGGSAINITDAPWQVLLKYGDGYICGGSIVAPDYILTAKHCVSGGTLPTSLKVIAGVTCKNEVNSSNTFNVSQIILHPTCDVALLKLSSNIPYNNSRRAINYWSSTNPTCYNVNNNVRVSGWGWLTPNGADPSNCLNAVNVHIISNQAASSALGKPVEDYEVATTGVGTVRQGACHGDSGGPLTYWLNTVNEHVLIGVVGWGRANCTGDNNTSPSIYTRVSSIAGWIFSNTNSISGPYNVPCSGTVTYSLPSGVAATWTVSSNLQILSGQGTNSITVKAASSTSNGASDWITVNGVVTKYVTVGVPPSVTSISGPSTAYYHPNTSNGIYYLYTASPSLSSSEVTYEWSTTISTTVVEPNGNNAYIKFLAPGSHTVLVRTKSVCSGSYSGYAIQNVYVTTASSYSLSQLSSRIFSLSETNLGEADTQRATQTVDYTLTNVATGAAVASGKMSASGGTLDFSSVPTGIYVLRIDTGNGTPETFKVILK